MTISLEYRQEEDELEIRIQDESLREEHGTGEDDLAHGGNTKEVIVLYKNGKVIHSLRFVSKQIVKLQDYRGGRFQVVGVQKV